MAFSKASLAALKNLLGPDRVDVSREARFACSMDSAKLSVLPDAVIRPRDPDEVSAVVRLCNAHKVPLTVRGGGSATTGATTPAKDGWVLDLSGWKGLEIDPVRGLAFAQPGVILSDLHAAAEAAGWFYPPDPSSQKYCTVGGTIATNAGGLRAAKYGVTRDYVVALEGVMPTGEWVRWGLDVRKFSAGYNMRDLWIGSEGTLGIVTGAVLRLVPRPARRATFLYGFADERAALQAVRSLLAAHIVPSILEFMDRQSVSCAERRRGGPLMPGHGGGMALLLVEVDGCASEVRSQSAAVARVIAKTAIASMHAATESEAEQLWEARRQCSPAMFLLGDTKINEDVVVPLDAQIPLIELTLRLRAETGLATPTFGHAADGNFHVHVMYDKGDAAHRGKARKAIDTLMRAVVEMGGAISGEHGIGMSKSGYFDLQHSSAERLAMQRVKDALDPNGILNPGKIFTPVDIWKLPRAKVTLPWEHKRH